MSEQKRVPIVTNFTEYFKEERDIYCQNKSNTQVSLQFELTPGRIESILIPKGKKPLNLTQLVPFIALKNSVDLRKMVNRRPPVLMLMSEAEYIAYYERLATRKGTSLEEEMDDAHQYQSDLQNKRVFTDADSKVRRTLEEEAEAREDLPPDPQDKVTPRIIGLCTAVGPDVQEKDRISVHAMMEEVEDLNGEETGDETLTRGDLEYLMGHVPYPEIRAWARAKLDEREAPMLEE